MKKILIFLIFLTYAVGSAKAIFITEEPEMDAYALTKAVQAGKIQELKIVIINTAKHELSERGTMEKEIAYNMSLNAYNLTLELKSDKIKVLTEQIRIPVLPASSERIVNFQISTPYNLSGEQSLTLKITYERIRYLDITGNVTESYEVDYYYRKEILEIPIKIEILQTAEPKLKVYPLTSTLYASEQNKIALQVANVGLSDARNVEVSIEGIRVVQPEKVIIPYLSQSSISVVELDVVAPEKEGELNVKTEINYTYFDGEKWVEGFDSETFKIFTEKIGKGIEFSVGREEFEREEKGILDFFVMNNHLYPIKGLELTISEPNGMDFSATRFFLGFLNSGEFRAIKVPYSIDKDADFGDREIEIFAKYTILASNLEEREVYRCVRVVIKEEPEFIALSKATVYHGENIINLEIMNNGEDARNIHFKLNPSPGIKLKMPEAYIAELRNGEKTNISFRVDVDDDVIAGNEYRIDIDYRAENTRGKEISDTFYAYMVVEERAWVERNIIIAIALILFIVGILVRFRLKRR